MMEKLLQLHPDKANLNVMGGVLGAVISNAAVSAAAAEGRPHPDEEVYDESDDSDADSAGDEGGGSGGDGHDSDGGSRRGSGASKRSKRGKRKKGRRSTKSKQDVTASDEGGAGKPKRKRHRPPAARHGLRPDEEILRSLLAHISQATLCRLITCPFHNHNVGNAQPTYVVPSQGVILLLVAVERVSMLLHYDRQTAKKVVKRKKSMHQNVPRYVAPKSFSIACVTTLVGAGSTPRGLSSATSAPRHLHLSTSAM